MYQLTYNPRWDHKLSSKLKVIANFLIICLRVCLWFTSVSWALIWRGLPLILLPFQVWFDVSAESLLLCFWDVSNCHVKLLAWMHQQAWNVNCMPKSTSMSLQYYISYISSETQMSFFEMCQNACQALELIASTGVKCELYASVYITECQTVIKPTSLLKAVSSQ